MADIAVLRRVIWQAASLIIAVFIVGLYLLWTNGAEREQAFETSQDAKMQSLFGYIEKLDGSVVAQGKDIQDLNEWRAGYAQGMFPMWDEWKRKHK